MGRRRYTDAEFPEAVADASVRTLSDLCRALGAHPGGGNYDNLRDHATRLGVDVDERFPGARMAGPVRAVERSVLQRALDEAANRTDALQSLGIQPTASAYRSLTRLAAAGEIDLPRYEGHAWSAGQTLPERRRRSLERKLGRGDGQARTTSDNSSWSSA